MENQDIISGLRNAVERGYSIELAVQSFVNAGYSKQDVLDSAKLLGYGNNIISNIPQNQQQNQQASQSQQIQQSSQSQNYSSSQMQSPQARQIQPNLPQIQPPQKTLPNLQQKQAYQPLPSPQQIQNNKKAWFAENWLILILGIILFFLVAGLLTSIFAKDWVSSLLGLS